MAIEPANKVAPGRAGTPRQGLTAMRRPLLILTIGAALSVGLAAQTSLDTFWHQPDGTNLQGTVLNCATGEGRRALPCGGLTSSMNTMQMPFNRSSNGDPIIFSGITTTAKQFEITKPADANAYRFVNPCNVDVRIRKVESLSENVTLTTDHIIILPTAPASWARATPCITPSRLRPTRCVSCFRPRRSLFSVPTPFPSRSMR